MFGSEDIAISVPARELAKVEVGRSVFSAKHLDSSPISDDLRFAIDLLRMTTDDVGAALHVIARPEMFTHGETQAWVHAQLDGAKHHVCFSDASCIRVVHGLQNHVFFYGLGYKMHFEALQRLLNRVPELFFSLDSQINTAICYRSRRGPATLHIQPNESPDSSLARLLPFYVHPHSSQESVGRIYSRPSMAVSEIEGAPLVQIPLSATAIADGLFMRMIGDLAAQYYYDSGTKVVLGLPSADDERRGNAGLLHDAVEAIRLGGTPLPHVAARNVFFSTVVLPELESPQSTLVLHNSFAIWRHSSNYLKKFSKIKIFSPRRPQIDIGVLKLVANIIGRPPEVVHYVDGSSWA